MRPKMVKLAKRKILPIKIATPQLLQRIQQMENNNNEMRSSHPNTTPYRQNAQFPPLNVPQDIPGVVAFTRKLNQECMNMMTTMRAANNDFDNRLEKMEETYRGIINDLSVRVKVLEIMYENQEREIDVIKNILTMQLQCTNNLTYRLINVNPYNQQQVNGLASASSIPPQEVPSQTTFMVNEDNGPSTSEFVRSTIEENALRNQENQQNTSNQGVRRCEFCNRTFATDRYLSLHQTRIPKYCARKRARVVSQQEKQQENAKRSKFS